MLPLHYGPSCAARALIVAEQGSASTSPDRSTIVAHAGGAVNPLTGFILATGYAEYLETLDGLPHLIAPSTSPAITTDSGLTSGSGRRLAARALKAVQIYVADVDARLIDHHGTIWLRLRLYLRSCLPCVAES